MCVVAADIEKSTFKIYVWPWTDVGEGPSSSKLNMHTDEDLPDSPPLDLTSSNISSTAIEVRWMPPAIPNGIITLYTVYFTIKDKTQNRTRLVNAVELVKAKLY